MSITDYDPAAPFPPVDSPAFSRDLRLTYRIVTTNEYLAGRTAAGQSAAMTGALLLREVADELDEQPGVYGAVPTVLLTHVRAYAAALVRELDTVDPVTACMLALYYTRNPLEGRSTRPLPYVDDEGRHFRAFNFSGENTAVRAWRFGADDGWSYSVDRDLDLDRDHDRLLVTGGHVTWHPLDGAAGDYFGEFVDAALAVIAANPSTPEVQA